MPMGRPLESRMTVECPQCEWSVEAANASVDAGRSFLGEAYDHADGHALEVARRLRIYGENYVESVPMDQDARDAAARRDTRNQTGLLDRTRRDH